MNRESAWQEAYKWLCQQRKNAPADGDVWHLRFHWERDGEAFRRRVEEGKHRLKPMRIVNRQWDEPIAMWDADDAMVLKWVALQITPLLPVHDKCHHVKGKGVHYSRNEVKAALDSGAYQFVYRTDIRGYYQHMLKSQLNALVQKWVEDPILLNLVEQYIAYSVEDGGEFHTPVNGISRGCALSPLLGASLLFHVDEMFAGKTDLFYARYMDDFLVLSKKRWPLRRAIRLLNEQMNVGDFTLHPDKTQIGRVEKGFDWLGLWFDEHGIRRSPRSLQMRASKILKLYEQSLEIKSRLSVTRNFPAWFDKGWITGAVLLFFPLFGHAACLPVSSPFVQVVNTGDLSLMYGENATFDWSVPLNVDIAPPFESCTITTQITPRGSSYRVLSGEFVASWGSQTAQLDHGVLFFSPTRNLGILGTDRNGGDTQLCFGQNGSCATTATRLTEVRGVTNVRRYLSTSDGAADFDVLLFVGSDLLGTIQYRGSYQSTPCTFRVRDLTVDLGDLPAGGQAIDTPFDLGLVCYGSSSSAPFDITFDGQAVGPGYFGGDVDGIANDTVGVRLEYNGSQIIPGGSISAQRPSTTSPVPISLVARLASTGLTPSPGSFSSRVELNITYR